MAVMLCARPISGSKQCRPAALAGTALVNVALRCKVSRGWITVESRIHGRTRAGPGGGVRRLSSTGMTSKSRVLSSRTLDQPTGPLGVGAVVAENIGHRLPGPIRTASRRLNEVRRRVQHDTPGHGGGAAGPIRTSLCRSRRLLVVADEPLDDDARKGRRALNAAGNPAGRMRDA
jgi:hypothetical protein